MTQIALEDYKNKRIYLHPDTVLLGVDPAAMHREHRERRRLNANNERNYPPMITFRGNEPKGRGAFTPRLTNLESGVRPVPFDTDHVLKIKNEIVCIADQISNQACFDRLPVISNVDIDIDFTPTEIITVNVSGTSPITDVQAAQLSEIHTRLGLNAADPFTDTPTQFRSQSGSIVIDVTGDGDTSATQTRRS